MVLLYQEKISSERKADVFGSATTLKCFNCKALFPIEYSTCPSCNMLK